MNHKGQASSELMSILAIIATMAIVAAVLTFSFSPATYEAQIQQSRNYWSGPAEPIKILDWKLYTANSSGTAATESNFTFTLKNSLDSDITIRRIDISPGRFNLTWFQNHTYIGESGALAIRLFPGEEVTVVIQHWQTGANRFIPPRVSKFNVNFTYDSTIGRKVQSGTIPAVMLNEYGQTGVSADCPGGTSSCGSVSCCPNERCEGGTVCNMGSCKTVSENCSSDDECCTNLGCEDGVCKSRHPCSWDSGPGLYQYCYDDCDQAEEYCSASSLMCECLPRAPKDCNVTSSYDNATMVCRPAACNPGYTCNRDTCSCQACQQESQNCTLDSQCCDRLYCDGGFCKEQNPHNCSSIDPITRAEWCVKDTCGASMSCNSTRDFPCNCTSGCVQTGDNCTYDAQCCDSLFCNATTGKCSAKTPKNCSIGTLPNASQYCSDNCLAAMGRGYDCKSEPDVSCKCGACQVQGAVCNTTGDCCSNDNLVCVGGFCLQNISCSNMTVKNATQVCTDNCNSTYYENSTCAANCTCVCPPPQATCGALGCCPPGAGCYTNSTGGLVCCDPSFWNNSTLTCNTTACQNAPCCMNTTNGFCNTTNPNLNISCCNETVAGRTLFCEITSADPLIGTCQEPSIDNECVPYGTLYYTNASGYLRQDCCFYPNHTVYFGTTPLGTTLKICCPQGSWGCGQDGAVVCCASGSCGDDDGGICCPLGDYPDFTPNEACMTAYRYKECCADPTSQCTDNLNPGYYDQCCEPGQEVCKAMSGSASVCCDKYGTASQCLDSASGVKKCCDSSSSGLPDGWATEICANDGQCCNACTNDGGFEKCCSNDGPGVYEICETDGECCPTSFYPIPAPPSFRGCSSNGVVEKCCAGPPFNQIPLLPSPGQYEICTDNNCCGPYPNVMCQTDKDSTKQTVCCATDQVAEGICCSEQKPSKVAAPDLNDASNYKCCLPGQSYVQGQCCDAASVYNDGGTWKCCGGSLLDICDWNASAIPPSCTKVIGQKCCSDYTAQACAYEQCIMGIPIGSPLCCSGSCKACGLGVGGDQYCYCCEETETPCDGCAKSCCDDTIGETPCPQAKECCAADEVCRVNGSVGLCCKLTETLCKDETGAWVCCGLPNAPVPRAAVPSIQICCPPGSTKSCEVSGCCDQAQCLNIPPSPASPAMENIEQLCCNASAKTVGKNYPGGGSWVCCNDTPIDQLDIGSEILYGCCGTKDLACNSTSPANECSATCCTPANVINSANFKASSLAPDIPNYCCNGTGPFELCVTSPGGSTVECCASPKTCSEDIWASSSTKDYKCCNTTAGEVQCNDVCCDLDVNACAKGDDTNSCCPKANTSYYYSVSDGLTPMFCCGAGTTPINGTGGVDTLCCPSSKMVCGTSPNQNCCQYGCDLTSSDKCYHPTGPPACPNGMFRCPSGECCPGGFSCGSSGCVYSCPNGGELRYP